MSLVTAFEGDSAHGRVVAPVMQSDRALPALRLAKTSRQIRIVAKALVVLFGLSIAGMIFAPWQQSVTGTGNVIAYAPLERQQVLEAPIKGRVVRWGDGIYENAKVTAGQVILEIQDLDPDLLDRLRQQRDAAQELVDSYERQLEAYDRQLIATQAIIPAYQSQVTAFESVRIETLAAVDELIAAAENKVRAEEQSLIGAKAAFVQLEADFIRQRNLFEEGLSAQAKFQEAEQKYLKAQSEVAKAEEYVAAAKSELEAKRREREAKDRELQAKVDSSVATLRKSESDVAKTESDISKTQGELSKAQKDLLDAEVKLSRQQSQLVVAPRDGYILSLTANEGQIIKEGDLLCVLVPETADLAVQVWVDGNDVPLVSPGRHVRLQFEGWPAVQFAGWPSVAVGTFGGEVVSVDATDDGKGRFRIIVQADPDSPPWPDARYLRQGVRANGWVLLNRVPLGYELWRQLNGFPPVAAMQDPSKTAEEAEKQLKLRK